jgi:hypothetical protein
MAEEAAIAVEIDCIQSLPLDALSARICALSPKSWQRPDWLAGVIGLKPRNPGASYLIEIP